MAEEKEEPKEAKVYHMKGSVGFEFEIGENSFTFRTQESTENNFAHLLALKEYTAKMIEYQNNPSLPSNAKMKPDMLRLLKSANRFCSIYSEKFGEIIYNNALKDDPKGDKPNIEIVPAKAGLRSE